MSRITTQRMMLVAVTLAIALIGTSVALDDKGPNADCTVRTISLSLADQGERCDTGIGIAGFAIHWAR